MSFPRKRESRFVAYLIGVGRTGCPGPSPLRTVRADLPHTALRSVVHLREDWQFEPAALGLRSPSFRSRQEDMRIDLLGLPTSGRQQTFRAAHGLRRPLRRAPLPRRLTHWVLSSGRLSVCCTSCLHLPARPSLHARYKRFLTTMGALTPATTFAALRLSSSMNSALCPSRRSPCFTCTAFRPFRLHPPDSPLRRFHTLPLSAQGSRLLRGALDFTIESQARRSARPYRVRSPTDWSFTSHCFGPHLAVTPLCLVTGRRAHA